MTKKRTASRGPTAPAPEIIAAETLPEFDVSFERPGMSVLTVTIAAASYEDAVDIAKKRFAGEL